ncbi:MAG: lysylphosphatidylglycerol synthase transmembrane domain-containing protein [Candidatus Bathyarchaeum tardum]|nr:MAG: lysylphosphatidylglycerol synthase transmembrane domain-containing protein [Candidatus Bathyarchaeum tardum]
MVEINNSINKNWLPRSKTLKRTVPLLILGLLIFVIYLYFFVDLPELLAVFQGIDIFYYSLAVVGVLVNLLTYSLTWQYLLKPLSINVGFKTTLLISWVGNFVEFFVPSESIGEDVSKSYLMAKASDENAGKVVASVLGQRILSMLVTVIILVLCSVLLFTLDFVIPSSMSVLIVLISVGTVIPLLFIILLCKKEKLSHRVIDLLIRFCAWASRGRLNLEDLRRKAKNSVYSFHQSMSILGKNPKILILPLVFSLVSYFFSVIVSYFVFASLGYFNISFVLLTLVYTLSRNFQSIPTMLPGEIGFLEIVMTSLYIALLGPQATAISAASTVLTRVLWVWLKVLLGFGALQWAVRKKLL